jgi:hypothetical protein
MAKKGKEILGASISKRALLKAFLLKNEKKKMASNLLKLPFLLMLPVPYVNVACSIR